MHFFRTDNSTSVPQQADVKVVSTSLAFTNVVVQQPLFLGIVLGNSVIETRLITRVLPGQTGTSGAAVPGQTVTVDAIDRTTLAASRVCTAVTDANGFARCIIPGNSSQQAALNRARSLIARYAGNLGSVPPYGGTDVGRVL